MCRKGARFLVPIFMLLLPMTMAQRVTTMRATTTTTEKPTLPPVTVIRPPFPSSTTPRRPTSTTTRRTIRPPILPHPETCPPPNNCTRKSPPICGRNTEGMCHRFDSVCELKLTNCATRDRRHAWHRVPMMQCRALRGNAIGRCNIYKPRCPRPLPHCQRPTRRGLCVISKNRRMCRVVGNRCLLRNLNCVAAPRERWIPTNVASCRGMRVSARPSACVKRRQG